MGPALAVLLLLQHAVGHREGKEERSGLGRRQGLQPFRHLSVVHRDGHEGGPHRDGVDQHLAPRVAHQSQERRLWDEPNSGKNALSPWPSFLTFITSVKSYL